MHQTSDDWVLYWRDDGSGDSTVAILQEFGQRAGQGRCVQVAEPPGRLGATGNFLALLRSVVGSLAERDMVAFADQDDVWLPQKIERGVAALNLAPRDEPILYCARQILVDPHLERIGLSERLRRSTALPGSADPERGDWLHGHAEPHGCPAGSRQPSLERHAARLVGLSAGHRRRRAGGAGRRSRWCSIASTRATWSAPPASTASRALAALHRGPALFMTVLREHVAALRAQPELLTARARAELAALEQALRGQRVAADSWHSRMPGLHRQTSARDAAVPLLVPYRLSPSQPQARSAARMCAGAGAVAATGGSSGNAIARASRCSRSARSSP